MVCGLERILCIICEMAGFCINWVNIAVSGIPPIMPSRSGSPSPPRPVGVDCRASPPVVVDLLVLFWPPPAAIFNINQPGINHKPVNNVATSLRIDQKIRSKNNLKHLMKKSHSVTVFEEKIMVGKLTSS